MARGLQRSASPATYGSVALAVLLLAWWLATAIPGLVPPRVLPSPADVVIRLGSLIVEPFSGQRFRFAKKLNKYKIYNK